MKLWKPKAGESFWWIIMPTSKNRPTFDIPVDGPCPVEESFSEGELGIFRTKSQAKEACRRLNKCLKDYHKEIGE